MSLKITNHGYALVENAILTTLSNIVQKGKTEDPILLDLDNFASTNGIAPDDVREACEVLESKGIIQRETLHPWSEVGCLVVRRPAFHVAVGQLAMPGSSSTSKEEAPAPLLEQLRDGEAVSFACGHISVTVREGDEPIEIVGFYRAGLVEGDEVDTAILSVVRRIDAAELPTFDADYEFVVGIEDEEDGRYVHCLHAMKFGPDEEENEFDLAVNYLEEYLLAFDPSADERLKIGLTPIELTVESGEEELEEQEGGEAI